MHACSELMFFIVWGPLFHTFLWILKGYLIKWSLQVGLMAYGAMPIFLKYQLPTMELQWLTKPLFPCSMFLKRSSPSILDLLFLIIAGWCRYMEWWEACDQDREKHWWCSGCKNLPALPQWMLSLQIRNSSKKGYL